MYIYSLQSTSNPKKFYIGVTENIEKRLGEWWETHCCHCEERSDEAIQLISLEIASALRPRNDRKGTFPPLPLEKHNNGEVPYTSKYRPWKLVLSIWFENKDKAFKFEQYLKTASGRAFSKKHF